MGEPLGERRGRERGDRDDGDPFLTETLELTPDGVKLSGRRDEAGSSAEGQGGEPPHDQLVGVRAESDRAIGVVKQPRKPVLHPARHGEQDRKSTRLNSSHVEISYAVFCLKKKNEALS